MSGTPSATDTTATGGRADAAPRPKHDRHQARPFAEAVAASWPAEMRSHAGHGQCRVPFVLSRRAPREHYLLAMPLHAPGLPAPRARRLRQDRGPWQRRVRPGGAGRAHRPARRSSAFPTRRSARRRRSCPSGWWCGRRRARASRHRRPGRLAAGHRGRGRRCRPAIKPGFGVLVLDPTGEGRAASCCTRASGRGRAADRHGRRRRRDGAADRHPARPGEDRRSRAAPSSPTRCSSELAPDRRERRASGPGTAPSEPA